MFVGLLLAVMVAFGSFVLAPVPVAQAAVVAVIPPTFIGVMENTSYNNFIFYWTWYTPMPEIAGGDASSAFNVSIDGLSHAGSVYIGHVGGVWRVTGISSACGAGGDWWRWYNDNTTVHLISWGAGSNATTGDSWAAGHFYSKLPNTGGSWVAAGAYLGVEPLSVSLSGPSAVDITRGGTWTATGAGGTAPYLYLWSYGLTSGFPSNGTSVAGATLHAVLASGTNTVQCTVTDSASTQGSAVASASVVSADEVAAYHIKLQRVGSVGQYIEATAWDNVGQAVEITGSADSQIAIYTAAPDPVGFNWIGIDEAVAVNNSLAWRWSGWGGIEHQWFRSTVTITGGHAVPVTAEFVGLGQNIDVWVTPDDTQIGAPVPPAVEEVEAVWITQAKGILLWLGNTLFVPTQAQLDQLLPSGSLGASLLEGTAWDTGASTWTMHTHWDGHQIMLINVNFADLGVFGSRVKTIVQAGICMALIYMVVVLL